MHLLPGGTGALSRWRRFFRRLDALQRRRPVTAVPVAVAKKYGDDRGGSLAALVAFYGFLAVFPLLLLFVTVAGIVLANNPAAEERIVHSALSEFPVVGDKLAENISALHKASPLAFVVSFIGLLWGSLGVTNHLQQASAIMWDVPRDKEPNLVKRVAPRPAAAGHDRGRGGRQRGPGRDRDLRATSTTCRWPPPRTRSLGAGCGQHRAPTWSRCTSWLRPGRHGDRSCRAR